MVIFQSPDTVMVKESVVFLISVESLPTDYVDRFKFRGAQAVTSPSGQEVIVQHNEHLYMLTCEVTGCIWTILPQKLWKSVYWATLLALPAGTICD